MIESRYKIEYVFPDEDQTVKKASPFRVLWYLLLIPLIGIVVAAITYDFSFKDISRDSLVLFEKAKVQIFNLGDHQGSKDLEKKSNILVKTPIDKITPEVNKKQTVSINQETPIATIDRYKTKITELTSKQQSQLESIQKQIKENSELSIKLNKLSEQFVLEQVKNETLNSQLAEQEKDRLELEEQLNKILEKTVVASDDSRDNTSTNESLEKKVTLEKSITKLTKEVIIASDDKITESKDAVLTQLKEVVKKTSKKPEKTEQSETDKIIQAMTTIAEETSNETTQKAIATTSIELEEQPKSEIVTKTEKVNDTKDDSNKSVQKNNEDSSSIASTLPSKNTAKETELASKTKEKNLANTLVKKENFTVSNPEAQEKMATKAVTDTKKVSSVDAIIATMQESQSHDDDSQASKTNQSIDSKLENDIKQQLVEKGDIIIDK